MKKIVLFIVFICSTNIFSQEIDENRNFVYKTNGEIIYGRYIDYKTPLFKSNYILVDEIKIPSNDVKFYQSERGFFGSLSQLGNGFAERIIKGRINYFEQITHAASAPMPMAGNNGMIAYGGSTTQISNFYNQGYGPLKVANYKNLIVDLKSNSESVVYLEKYHTAKQKRIIAYVLGGVAMVAGILTSTKKTGETTNSYNFESGRFEENDVTEIKPLNLAIGLAGFGTIIATYISSRKKKDYLQKAIVIYNE